MLSSPEQFSFLWDSASWFGVCSSYGVYLDRIGRESGLPRTWETWMSVTFVQTKRLPTMSVIGTFKPKVRLIYTVHVCWWGRVQIYCRILRPGKAQHLWLHPGPAGIMATNLGWSDSLCQKKEVLKPRAVFPKLNTTGCEYVRGDTRITRTILMRTELNKLN